MKPDMNEMMKQLQQMQARMQAAQESLQQQEVTGESGAGLVQVTMNGRHEVHRVRIDPSLLTEDCGMLEDLVAAACNDAVRRVEALGREQLGQMAAGLGVPPGGLRF